MSWYLEDIKIVLELLLIRVIHLQFALENDIQPLFFPWCIDTQRRQTASENVKEINHVYI